MINKGPVVPAYNIEEKQMEEYKMKTVKFDREALLKRHTFEYEELIPGVGIVAEEFGSNVVVRVMTPATSIDRTTSYFIFDKEDVTILNTDEEIEKAIFESYGLHKGCFIKSGPGIGVVEGASFHNETLIFKVYFDFSETKLYTGLVLDTFPNGKKVLDKSMKMSEVLSLFE